MRMQLKDFAQQAGITVLRDASFTYLATLDLPMLDRAVAVWDDAYLTIAAADPMVRAVIVPPELASKAPERLGLAIADAPKHAFLQAHQFLFERWRAAPKPPTSIAASAQVSPLAYVAPEGVRIGEEVEIEEFASIRTGVTIADGARVGAGAVIGGEGFDRKIVDGGLHMPRHYGGVRIGRGAVVQHNSCIDRGTFGNDTLIGADSALDNLVYVAHNATIGERTALCGGACVLGASRIGDDVWVGPNATISSGLAIGDGARVSIGAVVTKDTAAGATVSGNFAIDHQKHLSQLRQVR
ncbi:MAG: hypothetical protein MRY74_10120 [Neomegalonema sp.]|nr:hypothetical protein [Neomegalonema sp.]